MFILLLKRKRTAGTLFPFTPPQLNALGTVLLTHQLIDNFKIFYTFNII